MKKLLCILLTLTILSTSMIVFADNAVTMYAPDGRTASVPTGDVAAWKSVGWFDSPPIVMYAPDGRTAYVGTNDVPAWKSVGWFDSPPIVMYAPDGRTAYVGTNDVPAWKSVGWFDSPPIIMYAPDGRTAYVGKNDVAAWRAVGWFDSPVKYIPDIATMSKYEGKWWDEYSKRCNMDIIWISDNTFYITISWGSGMSGTTFWKMNAELSPDGTLTYSDCYCYDETRYGTKTNYLSGVGNFKYKNGYLYWNNIIENDYRCYFKKN